MSRAHLNEWSERSATEPPTAPVVCRRLGRDLELSGGSEASILRLEESSRSCSVGFRQSEKSVVSNAPASFDSNAELLTHLRTHRAQLPSWASPEPGLQSRPKARPRARPRTRPRPRPRLDRRMLQTQALLLSHLDDHALKGEEPTYQCVHCDQTFPGSTLLRIHQRSQCPAPLSVTFVAKVTVLR
ncbi:hypothetical protein WMY93_033667 [Mugilogobius chulae]|uniref:C2H2-type domain-containing protein n=1 Tax=Mugilogobius chulae TaxID=88201 RepID=A0AAW0MSJ8_9GOBI